MVVGGSTAKISRQASQNLGKYLLTILLLIGRYYLLTILLLIGMDCNPSKLKALQGQGWRRELLGIGLGLGVVVGSAGTVGTSMVHVSGGDSPAGGGRGAVEMHTVQSGVTAADGAATGGASLMGGTGSVRGSLAAGGGMKKWQT
jgi:hypothetical protein